MEFIVEKIGMSRTVDVPAVPVTLLKVVETKVCEVREDGKALVAYNSSKKLNKSIEGQQTKYGVSKEFNKFMTIEVAEGTEAGDLSTAVLAETATVKTSLNTKGRGFAGVMKRHGFGGGRKTHGSRSHRVPGSIGMSATPARVLKGKKLPGRMGYERTTVKNLRVLDVRPETNLIAIKGPLPGSNNSIIEICRL